jgi:hypothetical protein
MKSTAPCPASYTAKRRFTLDGSAALEAKLEALCEEIRLATLRLVPPSRLDGLVLGGGYGRGHGGVLKTDEGDAPYNDLEFYVFVRGNSVLNRARDAESFRSLGETLSPAAGLHIEFKIDSLQKLRRSVVSIFSYDLVSGHRVIYGANALFRGCEHHLDPGSIVPSEATRLLLNRCSGLLLAKELLLKPSLTFEDCDFVARNLAKAQLALGDVLLAAEGLYHWDCRKRALRLAGLAQQGNWPFANAILKHHTEGVRFKLHPIRAVKPVAAFKAEHQAITELALKEWLRIENSRLKTHFVSLHDYSFSADVKCDETKWWHNLLSNVRTFGVSAALKQNRHRYPRERLFNTLPLLLSRWEPAAEPVTRRHLQRQLQTGATDWHGLVNAYKQLWNAYG